MLDDNNSPNKGQTPLIQSKVGIFSVILAGFIIATGILDAMASPHFQNIQYEQTINPQVLQLLKNRQKKMYDEIQKCKQDPDCAKTLKGTPYEDDSYQDPYGGNSQDEDRNNDKNQDY